jgi:hypothetical protein
MAALFSLERAACVGMSKIILETNAMELEKGITTKELDRSVDGSLFRQIRDYMSSSFDICRVRHCPRSCNKVADYLAKYGRSVVSSGSVVFSSQVPTFVENLVSGDLEMVSNGNKLSEIKEKKLHHLESPKSPPLPLSTTSTTSPLGLPCPPTTTAVCSPAQHIIDLSTHF